MLIINWIIFMKYETSNKYPPKNNILASIQINTILAYSAKKKKTNITAACSVIKPLTSSDSNINIWIKYMHYIKLLLYIYIRYCY